MKGRRGSGTWDEGFIILPVAFTLEEIVVVAIRQFREFSAYARPMLVNSAAPFDRVKELAGAFEDRIFAVTKNSAISFDVLRESLFSALIGERIPPGEPLNIATVDDDIVVGAAVRGTSRTIVEDRKFFITHRECRRN